MHSNDNSKNNTEANDLTNYIVYFRYNILYIYVPYTVGTSCVLLLQLGLVVFCRWLANNGQITERSTFWYRLCGQKGSAVG